MIPLRITGLLTMVYSGKKVRREGFHHRKGEIYSVSGKEVRVKWEAFEMEKPNQKQQALPYTLSTENQGARSSQIPFFLMWEVSEGKRCRLHDKMRGKQDPMWTNKQTKKQTEVVSFCTIINHPQT